MNMLTTTQHPTADTTLVQRDALGVSHVHALLNARREVSALGYITSETGVLLGQMGYDPDALEHRIRNEP